MMAFPTTTTTTTLALHLALFFISLITLSSPVQGGGGPPTPTMAGKQTWSYVEVRPGAHMFWWLYYTTGVPDPTTRPLVLWLQGGPGASSTGFGNFEEIGPLDHNLQNRTHTWLQYVNLLFVDNPVGCGFSWVNDTKLLVKNNTQIASDLFQMFSKFLTKVPEFQTVPLYIFSESYGGKMAAQFALKLWKSIEAGKIKCNLKGVSLGDSWISPIDSVLTWAPYLFSTSLVDTAGYGAVNDAAHAVKTALDQGKFQEATKLWDQTEEVINNYTNGVNVYNILAPTEAQSLAAAQMHKENELVEENRKSGYPSVKDILSGFLSQESLHYQDPAKRKLSGKSESGRRIAGSSLLHQFHSDPLSTLMNGPIKQMLRIIPENVTWGGQQQLVFNALTEDFMRPVTQVVENLLNNTPIAVNVYSGQLDLIVDSMGTLKWVEEMKWPGITGWIKAARNPILLNNSTEMFVKSYKNFGFYWVLKAGHMVPADAPETAAEMLQLITGLKKMGN